MTKKVLFLFVFDLPPTKYNRLESEINTCLTIGQWHQNCLRQSLSGHFSPDWTAATKPPQVLLVEMEMVNLAGILLSSLLTLGLVMPLKALSETEDSSSDRRPGPVIAAELTIAHMAVLNCRRTRNTPKDQPMYGAFNGENLDSFFVVEEILGRPTAGLGYYRVIVAEVEKNAQQGIYDLMASDLYADMAATLETVVYLVTEEGSLITSDCLEESQVLFDRLTSYLSHRVTEVKSRQDRMLALEQ